MPDGQGNGAYNATHLKAVRCGNPLARLTGLRSTSIRNASVRWQIIWGADIRPHRRTLSGPYGSYPSQDIGPVASRARVLMGAASATEQAVASGFAERDQRPVPAGFRVRQE